MRKPPEQQRAVSSPLHCCRRARAAALEGTVTYLVTAETGATDVAFSRPWPHRPSKPALSRWSLGTARRVRGQAKCGFVHAGWEPANHVGRSEHAARAWTPHWLVSRAFWWLLEAWLFRDIGRPRRISNSFPSPACAVLISTLFSVIQVLRRTVLRTLYTLGSVISWCAARMRL